MPRYTWGLKPDRERPDRAKVKNAFGRLRVMLTGVESKTADAALEEIDAIARSMGAK